MVVGVLALQGDFEEHKKALDRLNVNNIFVRTVTDLQAIDALILPGGESTVMTKLLSFSGLDEAISKRVESGMPVFATCAGAILLSKSHLDLLDIEVDRNAYGSQLQSFSATLSVDGMGDLSVDFIRAPKITAVGEGVSVLAEHSGSPVLVRSGPMLASTFHTETTEDASLHSYFITICTACMKVA